MSKWIVFLLLLTGIIVWFLIIGVVIYLFYRFIRLLLRRPWQSIKHLLFWLQIDEVEWRRLHHAAEEWKKIDPDSWQANVYFKRHGRLGIMYDPKHEHWYQPVRYLFIIKNNT